MKQTAIVFGSGGGSNFKAIWKAISEEKLELQILAVLSDRKTAKILEFASEQNIPSIYCSPKTYPTFDEWESDLTKTITRLIPIGLF